MLRQPALAPNEAQLITYLLQFASSSDGCSKLPGAVAVQEGCAGRPVDTPPSFTEGVAQIGTALAGRGQGHTGTDHTANQGVMPTSMSSMRGKHLSSNDSKNLE